MKKLLRNISFIAVLLAGLSACTEAEPEYTDFPSKDVDFTYSVAANPDGEVEYALDYYVVSTIQFTNTSAKEGSVTWDFGDGTTSTEENPQHKYDKAGNYNVKLTVEGVGSRTYPLMIYDIAPVLSIKEQSADIITINDVSVDFDIFLPNPENKRVRYDWIFPEGTMTEDGQGITTFTGYADENGNVEYPGKLKFRNIGSQRITIRTTFDIDGENRRLEDSYVNVQVGADKEYKTLYYAALDGNIMAYKIIPDGVLPEGTKNLPFDMGVSSGTMPFNLVYAEYANAEGNNQGWIYILDAGKQYTYIDDSNGVNGDGQIRVMGVDGSQANVFVTNVGQAAFDDPFFGFVDGNNLIYTDRNTGIRQMALNLRSQVESNNRFVENQTLGYYGRGIAYGAISTSIYKDASGTYWWGKCYNGNGIFRFKSSDIGVLTEAPDEIVLNGANLKAFTLDEDRGNLYVWVTNTGSEGFYEFRIPAEGSTVGVAGATHKIMMNADPINTTDAEGVYCTQMAVDSETGYVYFGFNKAPSDQSNYPVGLKYYNPEDGSISNIDAVPDKILGVTINDNKTRLF